ncbi:MAG: hypothetical protein ACK4ND_04810 [Cytophagaceae bacterium]
MKTKMLSVIFSFLFLASNVFAQDDIFKVLVSKGANQVALGGATTFEAVKIGSKLGKDDKLTIAENGYIGLAHSSGKTIEIKKAGTYEIKTLIAEVAKQNVSSNKKYVDFVVGEMTATNEDMAGNRHKYMSVTGSVERGGDDAAINVLLPSRPEKTTVLNAPVYFKWQPVSGVSTYVVKITNMAEEVLHSMEVNEASASIDLSKLNLKKEKNLLVSVSAKGESKLASASYLLVRITDDKSKNLLKEIAEVKSDYGDETAINKLVLAAFFEEKGLLADALSCLEAAVAAEPEVEEFKAMYAQFLLRNKILK